LGAPGEQVEITADTTVRAIWKDAVATGEAPASEAGADNYILWGALGLIAVAVAAATVVVLKKRRAA
jgi:hypothetical protein